MPNLRWKRYRSAIEDCIGRSQRSDFRITDYSIQKTHLHMVVEARDKKALGRALQGLFSAMARTLNNLIGRRGSLFLDRYFSRILKTPREVRNVLAYVLNNARRHGARYNERYADPCSSGPWFEGWRSSPMNTSGDPPLTASPHTWLRNVGWRRRGLIQTHEVPGGR